MQFGICNEIFKGWNFGDVMRFARQAGYDVLEIAPFTIANHVTDISSTVRQQIRDEAAHVGIGISGIHWVLAETEGMYLNHPDPAVRGQTAKYFVNLVDFCADLGGRIIVLGSPKQRNVMAGASLSQAWEWARTTLRDAVQHAGERDVTICLEPLAPNDTNFINTAADAIRFAQQMESPNMKIILDVKAMCTESTPIPQIIRESWPHFAYFHANDRNLKGPGFGDVDFKPIAAALREVGYDGVVSVEVFKFDEGAEAIATRSIRYLKQVFG